MSNFHELNSLSLLRLMKSSTFGLGLKMFWNRLFSTEVQTNEVCRMFLLSNFSLERSLKFRNETLLKPHFTILSERGFCRYFVYQGAKFCCVPTAIEKLRQSEYRTSERHSAWANRLVALRSRPKVELFIRWTKLSEKEMKSSTSGSRKFVWMSLDLPTRSIRVLQTDRTSEDRPRDTDVDLRMGRTRLIN